MNNLLNPTNPFTIRADIELLALREPVIHAAMSLVRNGSITYEQALMECVTVLIKQNNDLVQMLLDSRLHTIQYVYPLGSNT